MFSTACNATVFVQKSVEEQYFVHGLIQKVTFTVYNQGPNAIEDVLIYDGTFSNKTVFNVDVKTLSNLRIASVPSNDQRSVSMDVEPVAAVEYVDSPARVTFKVEGAKKVCPFVSLLYPEKLTL